MFEAMRWCGTNLSTSTPSISWKDFGHGKTPVQCKNVKVEGGVRPAERCMSLL